MGAKGRARRRELPVGDQEEHEVGEGRHGHAEQRERRPAAQTRRDHGERRGGESANTERPDGRDRPEPPLHHAALLGPEDPPQRVGGGARERRPAPDQQPERGDADCVASRDRGVEVPADQALEARDRPGEPSRPVRPPHGIVRDQEADHRGAEQDQGQEREERLQRERRREGSHVVLGGSTEDRRRQTRDPGSR